MIEKFSILLAYTAGLISLLPTLALAAFVAALAWVSLRFLIQLATLLIS